MIDKEKFGALISEQIKEKSWSVKEFAKKVNFSDKAVYKWMSGKGIPDPETFLALSKIFGKPVEYFMPETEEVKEEQAKVVIDVADEVKKYKPLCVQHGILILDELIKIKNADVIKEFLKNYPISYREMLCAMQDNNQLKELYRFAVDYGAESLAAAVIKNDEDMIRKQIIRFFSLENDSGGYGNYGKNWLSGYIESLSESNAYEKPDSYIALKKLQLVNGKYYNGSEESTKQHLLEVLSEMEEYNG